MLSSKGLHKPVLVLNASYEPINVCAARRALGAGRYRARDRAMSQPQTTLSGEFALRCSNLHRYLGQGEGRVHVLRGVSFEARRGQVYAIVGPSGCGKSTLLYLLGLLDRPDGGEIAINGQLMSNDDDVARGDANRLRDAFDGVQRQILPTRFEPLDVLRLDAHPARDLLLGQPVGLSQGGEPIQQILV